MVDAQAWAKASAWRLRPRRHPRRLGGHTTTQREPSDATCGCMVGGSVAGATVPPKTNGLNVFANGDPNTLPFPVWLASSSQTARNPWPSEPMAIGAAMF